MKDSEDKENRITNLKKMMSNTKNLEEDYSDEESFEGEEEENNIVKTEDSELIDYLDEINEEKIPEIDDEFIYNPAKDDSKPTILKEENDIDENFLIKTNLKETEEDNFDLENAFDDEEEEEEEEKVEEKNYEADEVITKQFDNLLESKIGKFEVIPIVGIVVGVILIVIGAYIISNGVDRLVDNVASGESGVSAVIFVFIGLVILVVSVFKMFNLKNPLEGLINSINKIDKEKKPTDSKTKTQTKNLTPKTPIDREAYKVGEFDISSFKKNLNKPTSKLEGVKVKKDEAIISKKDTPQIKLDDIPPAKVKEKPVEKKEPSTDEKIIEEDSRSIDDIFAGVEDIEEIPILSVDDKVKKSPSKKDKE